jgi:hypothetical protein
MFEEYITGAGQNLLVHNIKDCKGEHCVIHNPSEHCMREFSTYWRSDRGLMERICPHGIGHPDPDDLAYKSLHMNEKRLSAESVHGCDGCCHE